MSLAFLAIHGHRALAISDGAVKRYHADGPVTRCSSTTPKFRKFGPDLIVASTNSSWAGEQVYDLIASEYSPGPGVVDRLGRCLARELPALHRRDAERIASLGIPGLKPGPAVALVGYDGSQGRARLVVFGDRDGDYTPYEGMAAVCLGVDNRELHQQMLAATHSTAWDDLPAALAEIIEAFSRQPEGQFVGGTIYTEHLGLGPLASTDSADGSTRTWTWTRGDNVAYIAKFEGLVALPVSSVFWPATQDVGPLAIAGTPGYSILGTGTDSYTAARPNYGASRIATLVPYYKVGAGYAPGDVVKLQFDGVGAPTAQGTVSVGADGAVTFTADLPDGAESCRYATSTSAFPDEATVAASGTVINGSTTGEVTPGVTLSFGDSVYITIVPFTATGLQLSSIRLLGSFLTYQATKTATFGLRAFVPESLGGSVSMTFVNGNARASSASYPAGLSVILWPLLPPGCDVTALEMECNMRVGTTATSEVRVDLYSGLATTTPTIVAQGYGTPNIGWQLVEASFSDDVETGDDLTIVVALFAESAANDVEAAYVRITYLMPQPDKSL